MATSNQAAARRELHSGVDYFALQWLADENVADVSSLPVTVKILLENILRHSDKNFVHEEDLDALAHWNGTAPAHDKERAFMPARVLLQDFTGVPAVVDLA